MDDSSENLQNQIDNKDKEINEAIKQMEIVHQSILELRRRKIDLDQSLSKARYNKEKLKIERSLLVSQFWHNKNQGL
jgi:hypothetical protein